MSDHNQKGSLNSYNENNYRMFTLMCHMDNTLANSGSIRPFDHLTVGLNGHNGSFWHANCKLLNKKPVEIEKM